KRTTQDRIFGNRAPCLHPGVVVAFATSTGDVDRPAGRKPPGHRQITKPVAKRQAIMASISAPVPEMPTTNGVMDKGLKKNALGYLSNIVIGVASTAPAYSLAATLGFIVAVKGVGVHAPAVMLVAFIPMLLVASAYKYFNRADPDAGTSF